MFLAVHNNFCNFFSCHHKLRFGAQRYRSKRLQKIRGLPEAYSSLILSEYINRSLRLHFDQLIVAEGRIKSFTDFKKVYRCTKDYYSSLKTTISEVDDILQISERRPDDFNSIRIGDILNNMTTESDFNDSYYVELCHRNNLILVTDDKDLINTQKNINIVTY